MVRRAVLFGLVVVGLFVMTCSHAAVIEVEVHGERAAAFGPIEGFIQITRAEDEIIEPQSFRLQNHPLAVEFLHDALHSTVSIVNGRRRETRSVRSTYRFMLPGVEPGEYVLPPVSVVIGGRRLQGETVPYFIHTGAISDGFCLRAFVRGPRILYPGQTTELVYRLAFRQPVEPAYQVLPFLEAKGFRKLKEPVITYSSQEDLTVQEIVQEVQALSPGTLYFDEAVMEGNTYRRDFFGRRIYDKERIRAQAAPVEVTVAPFPASGRPADFDGALGSFNLTAQLLGMNDVMVGDRLRLEVLVEGDGVWSTVRAPDLSRIRMIARDFRLSDLPPQVELLTNGKRFIYELRPLASEISEIPSISLSSFDPVSQHYDTAFSAPIALVVAQAPPLMTADVQVEAASSESQMQEPPVGSRVVDIRGALGIRARDLKREEPPWRALWLFPSVGVVWLLQWMVRRHLVARRAIVRTLTSQDLLLQASASWSVDPDRAARDLEASLLLRLYESGYASDIPVIGELSREGIIGEVRCFLEELHLAQYSQVRNLDTHHLNTAEALWANLSSSS